MWDSLQGSLDTSHSPGSFMTGTASVVYVVDDNQAVCRALQRLLKSAGFESVAFTSPQMFLDAPRPNPISCLVLDVIMPEINGYKLHELLAADGFDIPTIFMTAKDDAKSRAQAEKAGAVAYLAKPFDDEILLEAIRTALGRARKTAEARSRTNEKI